MFKIFVDGEAGTTGLQIFERLAKRNDLEILKINPELRKDVNERQKMINESDVTFLCLPDAASMESAALCTNPNTRIIDASTAHRVNPAWTYGMPELSAEQREAISKSKRIANPGCHASGFILGVHPLVASGILPKSANLAAYSITRALTFPPTASPVTPAAARSSSPNTKPKKPSATRLVNRRPSWLPPRTRLRSPTSTSPK